MELSQRCVLRDGRSVVVLDEGGVACESSPDWERTWVAWEEVDRVEIRAGRLRWVLVAPRRDER